MSRSIGSNETNWLGILAVVLMVLGLLCGLVSFVAGGGHLLGMGGLLVAASINAAILAVIEGI